MAGNCDIVPINFEKQLRFQLWITRDFLCRFHNEASRMVARTFLKTSFQAWLMTWWLSDSSQFSPPLASATAFFHRCCLPRLFIFPEKQGRTRGGKWQGERRKKTREGAILRVWSWSPRSTRSVEVSRCVWYTMVSYVASRRPMRNAISIWRPEEDSVHIRATYETQRTERWTRLAYALCETP